MVAQCPNDMTAPCIAEKILSCIKKYLRGRVKYLLENKMNMLEIKNISGNLKCAV